MPMFGGRMRTWLIAGSMLALGAAGSALAGSIGSNGIANNSVASIDVKNNDLRSLDVKNGELQSIDIRDGSIGLADLDTSATQTVLKYHKTITSAAETLYNAHGLKIEASCDDFVTFFNIDLIFTSTSDNSLGIKSLLRGDTWATDGEQDEDFDSGDHFINSFGIPAQGQTDVVTSSGVHTHVTWLAWPRMTACDFYGRVTVSA